MASLAIQMSARSSASTFNSRDASRSFSLISPVEIRRKLYCWQRERMVAGTLCTSVVAKMNTMYGGGSSMVFSRALNALLESMCTSSMI